MTLRRADLAAEPRTRVDILRTTAAVHGPEPAVDDGANHVAGRRAHELAHQWFGNSLTPSAWRDSSYGATAGLFGPWLDQPKLPPVPGRAGGLGRIR